MNEAPEKAWRVENVRDGGPSLRRGAGCIAGVGRLRRPSQRDLMRLAHQPPALMLPQTGERLKRDTLRAAHVVAVATVATQPVPLEALQKPPYQIPQAVPGVVVTPGAWALTNPPVCGHARPEAEPNGDQDSDPWTLEGALQLPLIIIDPSKIFACIGRGKHSDASKAKDIVYGEVAVKMVGGDAVTGVPSLEEQRSLARQASVLSRLNHPSIPRFFGCLWGTTEGCRVGLVLERVTGSTLMQLAETGSFTPDKRRSLWKQLFGVVGYLAGEGLLHCALTANNILVSEECGHPMTVKVLGLGSIVPVDVLMVAAGGGDSQSSRYAQVAVVLMAHAVRDLMLNCLHVSRQHPTTEEVEAMLQCSWPAAPTPTTPSQLYYNVLPQLATQRVLDASAEEPPQPQTPPQHTESVIARPESVSTAGAALPPSPPLPSPACLVVGSRHAALVACVATGQRSRSPEASVACPASKCVAACAAVEAQACAEEQQPAQTACGNSPATSGQVAAASRRKRHWWNRRHRRHGLAAMQALAVEAPQSVSQAAPRPWSQVTHRDPQEYCRHDFICPRPPPVPSAALLAAATEHVAGPTPVSSPAPPALPRLTTSMALAAGLRPRFQPLPFDSAAFVVAWV